MFNKFLASVFTIENFSKLAKVDAPTITSNINSYRCYSQKQRYRHLKLGKSPRLDRIYPKHLKKLKALINQLGHLFTVINFC